MLNPEKDARAPSSTLAGLPGRKAVVDISDGLTQRPGVSAFHYLGYSLCPDRAADALKGM